ncbi:MAG: hypothetical protein HYT85_11165 [candidate division NC10 bacterium]|nr:hypothetical protein [candidate division NC10 bacterium]
MVENAGTQALFDLWKKQIEEGTQAWTRLTGQGQAVDPALFWRPFMDQGMAAWSKLFTQGQVTPDQMTQWKQFLDQWIAAWGKVLEQAMGTEAFAQALGKHLEQWLAIQAPMKKVADESTEATLSALGIPSRSQVVGVARQLVEVEDRIEKLEDRLDTLMGRMDALFRALADHEAAAARRAAGKEAQ